MQKNQVMLSLAMFILIATGCATNHLAIVKSIDNEQYLLEDVNTKTEKLFVFNNPKYKRGEYVEILCPGDTVLIRSRHYDATIPQLLETKKKDNMYFLTDSIYVRTERKKFEMLKQQMQNAQSR